MAHVLVTDMRPKVGSFIVLGKWETPTPVVFAQIFYTCEISERETGCCHNVARKAV